ncbi:hypothetical protein [Chloroflexus sp.]|uniref:hypothetical protein n=1 Tax=Chloroflexus sp. TaxID=1904827 RepID=UPI002ADE1BCD|nr:hypothetical protein [Chloroflexus sp.]
MSKPLRPPPAHEDGWRGSMAAALQTAHGQSGLATVFSPQRDLLAVALLVDG